jgi:hypothetical protein
MNTAFRATTDIGLDNSGFNDTGTGNSGYGNTGVPALAA